MIGERKITKTALKLMMNAVHIYPYFFGFFNLNFYFFLFLFLFPPPLILREPEDTECKIKRIWPSAGQLSVKLQTLPDCVQFVHQTAQLYVLQQWLDLFIQALITYFANSKGQYRLTILYSVYRTCCAWHEAPRVSGMRMRS